MNGLKNDISTYLFDEAVPAFNIFALDDRVVNGNAKVAIADMEAANKLFEEIKEQYPEYIKQFYSTAANIFNENYIEPVEINDNDLPF